MKSGKPEKTGNSFRIPTLRRQITPLLVRPQIQLALTLSLDEIQLIVKALY